MQGHGVKSSCLHFNGLFNSLALAMFCDHGLDFYNTEIIFRLREACFLFFYNMRTLNIPSEPWLFPSLASNAEHSCPVLISESAQLFMLVSQSDCKQLQTKPLSALLSLWQKEKESMRARSRANINPHASSSRSQKNQQIEWGRFECGCGSSTWLGLVWIWGRTFITWLLPAILDWLMLFFNVPSQL